MGSDSHQNLILQLYRVSIHAPTWGATDDVVVFNGMLLVSIHAPTWGATSGGTDYVSQIEFQSTLPHGERLVKPLLNASTAVSIHAPTWGATWIGVNI